MEYKRGTKRIKKEGRRGDAVCMMKEGLRMGSGERRTRGQSGLVVKATSEDHEVHGSSPGLTLKENWFTHLIQYTIIFTRILPSAFPCMLLLQNVTPVASRGQ